MEFLRSRSSKTFWLLCDVMGDEQLRKAFPLIYAASVLLPCCSLICHLANPPGKTVLLEPRSTTTIFTNFSLPLMQNEPPLFPFHTCHGLWLVVYDSVMVASLRVEATSYSYLSPWFLTFRLPQSWLLTLTGQLEGCLNSL